MILFMLVRKSNAQTEFTSIFLLMLTNKHGRIQTCKPNKTRYRNDLKTIP
jgi:hypothetical protein